jgi:hypothetical protein
LISVNDPRSNVNDNLKSAADFLARSAWRRDIWTEIHRGKSKPKTAKFIAKRLKRKPQRVLMTGNELAKAHLVQKVKFEGQVAYIKDSFLDQHKRTILRLARDKKARDRLPTKVNPKGAPRSSTVRLKVWGRPYDIRELTVDDIASFSKVRRVRMVPAQRLAISENVFKEVVQRIIGEPGRFKDWPGERFDMLTTRLKLKATRISTAFAFKGPGKKGILMALDMGRRGDQIQRLFHSEAQIFMVQYWGQVDESVAELMRTFAVVRSLYHSGQRIYYGVIDGKDSDRLALAYPLAFKLPKAQASQKRSRPSHS